MDKTKLDINNPHHQQLIALMANFVEKFGYSPRDLFALMNDSQNQLWPALNQIESERKGES